jgi:5'-nucleotidase
MTKQRIAIDMDDVMTATGKKILEVYNDKIGTNFTKNDFLNKNFYEVFDQSNYSIIRDAIFQVGFFRELEVMPDAVEVVKALHDKYDVFVVSAAMEFPNSLIEKHDWLAEHFPFIHWKNMVLCGDKSIISADIMIDDHEKNLRTFKGKTLMFDAIHNQKVTEFQRVMSWKEVAEILL